MTPKAPAPASLIDMAQGYARGKILCAAVHLGIADALGQGEKTLEELAVATSSNPDALHRLLRALTALNLLKEIAPARFALTPFGDPLRKDAPNSQWASIIFWADLLCDSWTYLADCVRAGNRSGAEQAMQKLGTKSRWSSFPNPQSIFHAVFSEPNPDHLAPYVAACDLSHCDVVADLGGAGGSFLAAILNAHPRLKGILLDRQDAVDRAARRFEAAGLTLRARLIAGDLLSEVPAGANAYILKCVLHGYEDTDARRILRHCHDVMTPDNRLLVIEAVIPDKIDPSDPHLMAMLMSDINMLAVTSGRERTSTQWTTLLSSTGFRISQTLPVPGSHLSVIQAASMA